MSIINLDKIFKPRRIALIGVSTNPNSVSGKTLSNLVGGGFNGVVYPVNPDHEAVLGIVCYPDLKSLPHIPDLAIICSPAAKVPEAVQQCASNGIHGIIIMSAGFRETGTEGIALEEKICRIKSCFPELRILGPNCLGVIVPGLNLNASFAAGIPRAGNIAFISQSGALCSSVLDWAIQEKIGFSYFISTGNCLDIDFGDLIDYVGEDPATRSIILYLEHLQNARGFMSAARSFARNKPILVYKAGRFPESAEVAASHTGAMAAEDKIYDAVFQRAGIVRVDDINEIFACAELLGRNKIPAGPRLGIITNAGGPGVMASDKLIALRGELARLAEETITELNHNLPEFWSHRNPVDVLGDARSKRFAKAVEIVIKDPGVDAVLTILTPQAMTNAAATARELVNIAEKSAKPVIAAFLGGASMREGIDILLKAGIPVYHTPEDAIRAFMILVEYRRNLNQLYETPREIPLEFKLDRSAIRKELIREIPSRNRILSECNSKKFLEKYGIKTTLPLKAESREAAVKIAEELSFPVVMKIDSPDITHKSDCGGVALNLDSAYSVAHSYEIMMEKVRSRFPAARIEGVTIQKMYDLSQGVELLLGSKKDSIFGAVILAGMGGTRAEILADQNIGLPPLNERLARALIERLKVYRLLQGYRQDSAKNIDLLLETIIRFSYLIADFEEIQEMDINPLLVTEKEVVALDARIILDAPLLAEPKKMYAHIILQPYPEHYSRKIFLPDGKPVLLRPIRPEDEPLWLKLLASCSQESIYARFRYMFHWNSHEVAARYCYIDYSREIAIVAEIEEHKERKLVGVGRLIADPNHETAEYAILIADAWQQKDLGRQITAFCLEIARDWGLKKFVAQTTSDNLRMIAVFKKFDFAIYYNSDSTVEVEKIL